MEKFERVLKIISFTLGTGVFTFLCWLMLVYQNFPETTAYILGGILALGALAGSYFVGPYFIK
ncbi:MAG: hypothetical protein OEY93_05025 [Anaerolineae bacterium]|nr:hypothetical protein [Anaerolineae bacterium]